MPVDAANARIFGSDDDAVWVGKTLGAVLPIDLSEPGPDFDDLGWLHSDGPEFAPSDSVEKFRGHQGGRVVRTKMTESDSVFTVQCLETTAITLGLQHNIKEHNTTAGVSTLRLSSGRRVIARPWVLDFFDEDEITLHHRYVVPRGEIGERSSFKFANSDITGYTFPIQIIGDFFLITNDGALVVISPTP